MTIHLEAGDSVNLTTGVVTRSTATATATDFRERIMRDSVQRAYRNDVNALAYIIRHRHA